MHTFWLHEFNNDDEELGYNLVGDTQRFAYLMKAPGADTLEVGAGVMGDWASGWQLRADIDGQFAEDYNAVILSGSVLYEF